MYHPELHTKPFMLGRHGESIRNAGDMFQGRGDEEPGLPPNRLTLKGEQQISAAPRVLLAAGITVRQVASSEMLRAIDSATLFMAAHPHPKPTHVKTPIAGLKEVSQKGWENIYTREEAKKLHAAALILETTTLQDAGLPSALEAYIPWTMTLGQGQSPLGAALAGLAALEAYGPQPGELIITHAMLNRYMEAIAVRAPKVDRMRLTQMLEDSTSAREKITILQELYELGIPRFEIADNPQNRQANASATEYYVIHSSSLWRPGRRIDLPEAVTPHAYVEHRRGANGLWGRITPHHPPTAAPANE